MEWSYLSIPKLQCLHCWSLGMDKWFHPTLYWACDYLSMLGVKFIHVSKRGHLRYPIGFWSGHRYAISSSRLECFRISKTYTVVIGYTPSKIMRAGTLFVDLRILKLNNIKHYILQLSIFRDSYQEEYCVKSWWKLCDSQDFSLEWRHNEYDGVSNHQPHDCLLNCLCMR